MTCVGAKVPKVRCGLLFRDKLTKRLISVGFLDFLLVWGKGTTNALSIIISDNFQDVTTVSGISPSVNVRTIGNSPKEIIVQLDGNF